MDRVVNSGRRLAFVMTVACLVLAGVAGVAQAKGARTSVKGTVVHRNQGAGSFVVADRKGHLFAVHAQESPSPGAKVVVSIRALANGTFAGTTTKQHKTGRRSRVHVHGTVSHVNGAADTFTLSGTGVSMLVKARMGDTPPPEGSVVTVTGTVDEEDEGEIDEEDIQEEGEDNNGFKLEGKILEVNTEARTVTVSADDDGQSGEAVVVNVPTALDISKFMIGEEVELNVQPLEGGGFELLGSSSDDGEQGADDGEDQQGEQGDNGKGDGNENGH